MKIRQSFVVISFEEIPHHHRTIDLGRIRWLLSKIAHEPLSQSDGPQGFKLTSKQDRIALGSAGSYIVVAIFVNFVLIVLTSLDLKAFDRVLKS